MQHSPGFLKVVDDAKTRVRELTIDELRERLKHNPRLVIIDVREDLEWAAGHIPEAVHLGRGVFERDVETRQPVRDAEMVLYCGGGYRSALTADSAQKMGYTNVWSLIGGYKGLVAAGWPIQKEN
jgi:rhodanese-related sulfurtransferase